MKSTAVVIPSVFFENSPLVLFEAMNFCKPVIVSDVGGLPEFVKDSYNGLVFKAGNSTQLSEKIKLLLNSKKKTSIFVKRNLKLLKSFSAKNHLKLIEKFYNELLINSKSL
jgi:glycosyltransferase involved in cell wall biosynthesis